QHLLMRMADQLVDAAAQETRRGGICEDKPAFFVRGIDRILRALKQGSDQAARGLLRPHRAGNLCESTRLAAFIFDTDQHPFHEHPALIAAEMPAHVGRSSVCPGTRHFLFGGGLRAVFGGENLAERLSGKFLFTIPEEPFDTRIPADDRPLGVNQENRKILEFLNEQFVQAGTILFVCHPAKGGAIAPPSQTCRSVSLVTKTPITS